MSEHATGSSPTDGDPAYDRCADCGHTRVYHVGAGGAAIGCQLISVQTDAQCFCEAFADPQATPDRAAERERLVRMAEDTQKLIRTSEEYTDMLLAYLRPVVAAISEIDSESNA